MNYRKRQHIIYLKIMLFLLYCHFRNDLTQNNQIKNTP